MRVGIVDLMEGLGFPLVPLAVDDTGELVISETRHGFVCANAGVDLSNVDEGRLVRRPGDAAGCTVAGVTGWLERIRSPGSTVALIFTWPATPLAS